jgi:hypothetical protein
MGLLYTCALLQRTGQHMQPHMYMAEPHSLVCGGFERLLPPPPAFAFNLVTSTLSREICSARPCHPDSPASNLATTTSVPTSFVNAAVVRCNSRRRSWHSRRYSRILFVSPLPSLCAPPPTDARSSGDDRDRFELVDTRAALAALPPPPVASASFVWARASEAAVRSNLASRLRIAFRISPASFAAVLARARSALTAAVRSRFRFESDAILPDAVAPAGISPSTSMSDPAGCACAAVASSIFKASISVRRFWFAAYPQRREARRDGCVRMCKYMLLWSQVGGNKTAVAETQESEPPRKPLMKESRWGTCEMHERSRARVRVRQRNRDCSQRLWCTRSKATCVRQRPTWRVAT